MKKYFINVVVILIACLLLAACGSSAQVPTQEPTSEYESWVDYELIDVRTGETFAISDYAGKVVLLETMAVWCPNCIRQGAEVRKLHEMLDNPEDLISVSLDVDVNEDEAMLLEYIEEFGFEWHFAVSPTPVNRALGNLYTAQYLNPPLSPMMVIDREGEVHHLDYGHKDAEMLLEFVEPYLTP